MPFWKKKTPIEKQAEEYLVYWSDRYSPFSANTHQYWLEHLIPFLRARYVENALDITEEDVGEFKWYVARFFGTFLCEIDALRTVRNFTAWAKRAKMQEMKTLQKEVAGKLGRKPDLAVDAKIAELRIHKMPFRAIGRQLGLDVKSVYRRYQRIKKM